MTDDQQKQSDHDTLTRLETKFDAFAIEMRAAYIGVTTNVSDHEARIRVLEKSAEQVISSTRAVGIIASLVGAFIGATASIVVIISGVVGKHNG